MFLGNDNTRFGSTSLNAVSTKPLDEQQAVFDWIVFVRNHNNLCLTNIPYPLTILVKTDMTQFLLP